MIRQEADKFIPLIEAWHIGKTLQHHDCDNVWRDLVDAINFNDMPSEYRIKPEPKLRPWKPEEVPVGALVKTNDTGSRWVILGVSANEEVYVSCNDATRTAEYLFENYTYSTDGGKTWLPCGVREDAQ